MNYRTITIEVAGMRPQDVRILLDGVQVKNWREMKFEAGINTLPTLTLSTFPNPRTLEANEKDGFK